MSPETGIRDAEKYEVTWKARLYEERNASNKKRQVKFEEFLVKHFLPFSEANKKSFERDVIVCRFALKHFKGKNLRDSKKIVIFGRTPQQADGAFARKFSLKAAKPRFFGKRTYALSGLQRKPTQQADGEFF